MRIQILILGFKGLTNIFIDEHQELVPAFFFTPFSWLSIRRTVRLWESAHHYPSPKPTLTLTSHLGQNVCVGEGKVGIFPETYKDPEGHLS